MRDARLAIEVDGHQIDNLFWTPEDGCGSSALLLHPHPLYGGNMLDAVVSMIHRTLAENGFCTLRINFRGVGRQDSVFAGVGGAVEDALMAHASLVRATKHSQVGVLGYSFGASVALHVAAEYDVAFLVALSPSYKIVEEVKESQDILPRIKCPVLLVHGSKDSVVPPSDSELIASQIGSKDFTMEILEGVGHFYHESLDFVGRTLSEFLERLHSKGTGRKS
ncbi:MAG: alpha/beta hydrolase [Candidatus Thorarchaeota archaeon]|nr:MAG: alpha/beta hydrolase [Candidatus Thorarchaeota archaeon]